MSLSDSNKMASFFNIVHKTDKSYAPFHASTHEYATRLFYGILANKPELVGHLEIVETPRLPRPRPTALGIAVLCKKYIVILQCLLVPPSVSPT
jgi:hypothetical protein